MAKSVQSLQLNLTLARHVTRDRNVWHSPVTASGNLGCPIAEIIC